MRGRKWLALLLSLILATGALPAALAATATDPTGTCDHNWKRTGTTATCYEGGVIVYTCTKCGEIRREQTGPLGHDYGPMETDIPATCTEPGRDVRYCRRDHTHKWYFDVEPLGHDWGEWEVVTQPTAEAEGLERRVCRRDPSHVEERSIPKLSEKDEAPPTADIKLTGILDRYMYYVGEDMTVIYILTNTGDVPLTLVSQEGDAEGVPLPATLAPDEVYQWHVDEKVSAAMFQDGFHVNPETGEKTEATYPNSTLSRFAAVDYAYDPGEGNLWDCYAEAAPTAKVVDGAAMPSLGLTVTQQGTPKAVYEVDDILSFDTTMINNGTADLVECYTVFEDDRASFKSEGGKIDLAIGDYSTNGGWTYTIRPEDAGTTFTLRWTAHGLTADGSTSVTSNTVTVNVAVAGSSDTGPALALTNADGSGAGKAAGDWVYTDLTLTNVGDTTLIVQALTVDTPNGATVSDYDWSNFSTAVEGTKYWAGEYDTFRLLIRVMPGDVAEGKVERKVFLIANEKEDNLPPYVYSNTVTVNIPLDGEPVPEPVKAELTLTVTCLNPEPFWFNFDGKTDPIGYALDVCNTGKVPVLIEEVRQEAEGDPTYADLTALGLLLFPGEHTGMSAGYVFDEAQETDGKLNISFSVNGDSEAGPVASNVVNLAHPVGEMPPWTPDPTEVVISKAETSHSLNLGGYVEGETVTYDVTVTNISETAIPSLLVHDDLIGSEADVILSDLQPDESRTVSFQYTVTGPDVDAGYVRNVANAVWICPVTGEEQRAWTDCIVPTAEIPDKKVYGFDLIKECLTAVPAGGYFRENDPVTFYIYLENTSDAELYDVNLTDPLTGDTVHYDTMAPGQIDDLYFTYTITNMDAWNGSVTNTVTVTGKDAGGNVYARSDSVTIPTGIPPESSASLYIFKEVTNDPKDPRGYQKDEVITYTITITNDGHEILYNVEVYDLAPDGPRYLGIIAELLPGESKTYPFQWTVTEQDVWDKWVINAAMVYYDTREIPGNAKTSNIVESPTWGEDPPPPPDRKPGRDEVCVTTIKAAGDNSAWYDLDLCGDHAQTEAAAAELLAAAQTPEEQAAAWQAIGALWLEEIHGLYGELADRAGGRARVAVWTDRAALDAFAQSMGDRLALRYPDDPVAAARTAAEWLMRQCAELCYLSGRAPEARPDSRIFGRLSAVPSVMIAGMPCACGLEVVQDGSDKVQINERLCASLAEGQAAVNAMLDKSVTRAQYADVFARAQRLWRTELNRTANAAYIAADEEHRQAVVGGSLAFDRWIAARTELLGAFYPDDPGTVAEVICTLMRQQVLTLCEAE